MQNIHNEIITDSYIVKDMEISHERQILYSLPLRLSAGICTLYAVADRPVPKQYMSFLILLLAIVMTCGYIWTSSLQPYMTMSLPKTSIITIRPAKTPIQIQVKPKESKPAVNIKPSAKPVTTPAVKAAGSKAEIAAKGPVNERIAAVIMNTNNKIPQSTAMEYSQHIMEASQIFGLDPALVTGVMLVESTGRRYARSSAGAVGLMQVMWSVHGNSIKKKFPHIKSVNDMYIARNGILTGCWILKGYLERSGGNINKALTRYLGGPAGKYAKKVHYYARKVN